MKQSLEEKRIHRRIYDRAYRLNHKTERKIYCLTHKDEIKANGAAYRQRPKTKAKKAIYNRAYSFANREKISARHRIYEQRPEAKIKRETYRRNPEVKAKRAVYDREYNQRPEVKARRQNPEIMARRATYQRDWGLKREYGLNLFDLGLILEKQGNTCAICKTDKFSGHGPCVDHDHDTGKVRGILCHKCNVVLGLINNSTLIAQEIIKYLNFHKETK